MTGPAPFWERPLTFAKMLDVGLRSQYVASFYAAPLLIRQRRGLVVFTSSFDWSVCWRRAWKPALWRAEGQRRQIRGGHGRRLSQSRCRRRIDLDGTLENGALRCRSRAQRRIRGFHGERGNAPIYRQDHRVALSGSRLYGGLPQTAGRGPRLGVRYGIKDEGREPPSYRAMLGEPRQPSERHRRVEARFPCVAE